MTDHADTPTDNRRQIVDTAMPHASTIESNGRCVFCGLPSHDPGPCLKRPHPAVTDHADTARAILDAIEDEWRRRRQAQGILRATFWAARLYLSRRRFKNFAVERGLMREWDRVHW